MHCIVIQRRWFLWLNNDFVIFLDYIHSSGSLRVIVASDNEAKVTAIKSAFHETFGLATVYGVNCQPKNVAAQPVGFAAARQASNERIQIIRQDHPEAKEPGAVLIAVDNFLLEVGDDEWVDQGCLILSDVSRQIQLCCYTQPTPVPFPVIQQLQKATDENYPLSWCGFSTTVGSVRIQSLLIILKFLVSSFLHDRILVLCID